MRKSPFSILILLLLYFSLQMCGQILAKFSSGAESIFNPFTLGSYICFISRGFIWILILNRLRVIAAYPLNGLSYILILPVSFFVFGETISLSRMFSGLLIACGVVLLTLGEYFSTGKTKVDRSVRR